MTTLICDRTRRSIGLGLLCIVLSTPMACDRGPSIETVRALQERGELDASLEQLRVLLVSQGDDPEVQFRYGLALRRTGEPDLAVWALRKAREHEAWAVQAGTELTLAALASQTWENAIEASTRVLELDPENVRMLAMRAEAHLGRLSEPERALEDIERALDIQPDHSGLHAARVRALLMMNEVEAAVEAMSELELPADTGDPQSEVVRGQICIARASLESARGQRESAETTIRKCIEEFPGQHAVVDGSVRFFDEGGQSWEGNRVLRDALIEVPEALNYRKLLAERLRAANRNADAEQLLRDGLRLKTPWLVTGTLAALAEHYVAVDDFDAAIEAYGAALELVDEPSESAWLTQADLLARAERNEEALAVAARLSSDAHRGLIEARVYLNQHRPALALARLDEVLPSWPDNPGARYYAARAAEQLGQFDRAVDEYRQSIRSDASATDAGLRLAKLHAAQGAHADAWVAITHHFKAHPQDPEGAEFLVRLARRTGSTRQLATIMPSLEGTPVWGRIVAVQSELLAESQGPARAVELIDSGSRVDFTRDHNVPILRALVIQLVAGGQGERALRLARETRTARDEVAAFHEIEGRVLEGLATESTSARTAYARALEIDPDHVLAVEGLARLAERDGDTAAAITLYDRAARLAPEQSEALRWAARLAWNHLSSAEGAERWEALLREHPWDLEATLALGRLKLLERPQDEQTLELARRAIRFRGGEEAEALLRSVLSVRGDSSASATDNGVTAANAKTEG